MAAAGGVLGPSRWEASRALLLIASVKSKIREQESAGRGPMQCLVPSLSWWIRVSVKSGIHTLGREPVPKGTGPAQRAKHVR